MNVSETLTLKAFDFERWVRGRMMRFIRQETADVDDLSSRPYKVTLEQTVSRHSSSGHSSGYSFTFDMGLKDFDVFIEKGKVEFDIYQAYMKNKVRVRRLDGGVLHRVTYGRDPNSFHTIRAPIVIEDSAFFAACIRDRSVRKEFLLNFT
jgi:hypothetical protein